MTFICKPTSKKNPPFAKRNPPKKPKKVKVTTIVHTGTKPNGHQTPR